MSSKYQRSSNAEKAKSTIRQAYQDPPNRTNQTGEKFHFHLYENDLQERINRIADDDDGDLIVDRQPNSSSTTGSNRRIEANDRRHDAVIFGDKTLEEQQSDQSWNDHRQSSKYSATSLAGPLLLEDPTAKRLRWQNQMRDLWLKRSNIKSSSKTIEMDLS